MRHASGHNYRNSSFIVDVAMGQIPRSTERISSFYANRFNGLGGVVIHAHGNWSMQLSVYGWHTILNLPTAGFDYLY